MSKQNYLDKLVEIAFAMDRKATIQHERTKKIQRMASLAKQSLKDTEEFKQLEREYRSPIVTDFGNEMNDLQRVVKQLKKYYKYE